MYILLTKDYKGWKAGDRLDCTAEKGAELIANGFGKEVQRVKSNSSDKEKSGEPANPKG